MNKLCLIVTLSFLSTSCSSLFNFTDSFKRKDSSWKTMCDHPNKNTKNDASVLHNGGFLISSEDGLYTDGKAGPRKLMYRRFLNKVTNENAQLKMQLNYRVRNEELVECSKISVDLMKSGMDEMQKFEDH